MANYSSPFSQLFINATEPTNYAEDFLRGQNLGLQNNRLSVENEILRQQQNFNQNAQQNNAQKESQLGALLQNYNPQDLQTLALIAKNDPKLAETLSKISGDYSDVALRKQQSALVAQQIQEQQIQNAALRQQQLSSFLGNASNYLSAAPEEQKAAIYTSLLKDAQKNGLPISNYFKGGYTPQKANLLQELSKAYAPIGQMSPQEKVFATTMARENAKTVQKIPEEISVLNKTITTLDDLNAKLDTIGPTGPSLLSNKYLGYISPGANQSDREAFAAQTNQLVAQLTSQLKGSLSDKELKFLANSTLGLNNTKEGNEKIIDTLKRAAQRESQRKQIFADYVEANNGSSIGFNKYFEQYKKTDPLYANSESSNTSRQKMIEQLRSKGYE